MTTKKTTPKTPEMATLKIECSADVAKYIQKRLPPAEITRILLSHIPQQVDA